ncbi:MAG TPA: hypothetical protein VLB90_02250 [Pseudomonadales bacterium]|nr:hypothetical protein [Pseudomonadales bacterium]
MNKYLPFYSLLLIFLLCGCAHQPDNYTEQQTRITSLTMELQKLAPEASTTEAHTLASTAVYTAATLRENYQVSMAPWIHNMEVNAGLKSRGLCFHYARDMGAALQPLVAPHWNMYFVQARPNEILEHNAIVITGTGKPWQSGIVLDGWRYSGVLYFGPVTQDKYPWQLKNNTNENPAVTTLNHPGF